VKLGPGAYAGIVSRGAAFLVDSTAVVIGCTVGFELTVAILSTIGVAHLTNGDLPQAIGYLVVVPVAFWFYNAGFWTLMGRTPGMIILGVRVVSRDGTPPGLRRSVIRAFGYWVSAIFFVGFAWIAVDRRRQGFHDKLAGTFVIYDSSIG
jgi:uncharacterized RDD family membrane protein YckC